MESVFFIEKRAYPRFPIGIPLSYPDTSLNDTIHTQTYDISTEGLSIIIDKELPVGSSLDICLHMPDTQEEIYRKGKVVWLKTVNPKKYRIGIKLEKPYLKPITLVLRIIQAKRHY